MEQQSAVYLDALGANVALSPAMKQELDTLGYTVVHNVVDAEWLAGDAARLSTPSSRERAIIWRSSTTRRRRQPASPT